MARLATKKPLSRFSKVAGKIVVKELKPSAVDAKYFGFEPNYVDTQPDSADRFHSLTYAFNWYSKFYGFKDAKEFILDYLTVNSKDAMIKTIKKIPDASFSTTFGWLARMSLRGLVLTEEEQTRFDAEISRLVSLVKNDDQTVESKPSGKVVNIQEIMKERATEAAGEIEGIFDDYLANGASKVFNTKNSVIPVLEERKILPQHISMLTSHWESVRKEYVELQSGDCEQLVEAYSYLSKMQVKNVIKFIDSILTDLNGYVSLKRMSKKPRARKAVPVERIVAKLKYCKSFEDTAQKLKLTSLPPTKLHNCSEAWVYDTKKRKIHHYVSDEYSRVLTVKGNSLQGFDKINSGVKTLRKPSEQLKALTGSKPAARKYFKDIKSVQTVPNGRFNENMVILKAF